MPATSDEVLELLSSSVLLPPYEVQRLQQEVNADRSLADPAVLIRHLVERKHLTGYQAEELAAGRTDRLRLGNYVLLDVLGQGGMGKVYRARHERMKREVALKVLPAEAAESDSAVRRFHREVEVAARLQHTNIVAAYDADEAEGTSFLVMEYVHGVSLAEQVRQHGPLTVPQAVRCILQAASGLAYAHRHGIIHRDIKPSNLLLDETGQVKILDMGLARAQWDRGLETAAATQDYLTQTGMVLGTIDYLAPEQARNIKAADHRADIYSLGCTLYYLLAAKPLYEGKTLLEKIAAHQKSEIPRLSDVNSQVPEELEQAFQRMVAKHPEDRYQSMVELIEGLKGLATGGDSADSLIVLTPVGDGSLDSSGPTLVKRRDDTSVAVPSGTLSSVEVMLSGVWQRTGLLTKLFFLAAAVGGVLLAGVYLGSRVGGGREQSNRSSAPPTVGQGSQPVADGAKPTAAAPDTKGQEQPGAGAQAEIRPAPTDVKPEPVDVDRVVARRVLALRGTVGIVVHFQPRTVTQEQDLPAEPFVVREIRVSSPEWTDGDLANVGQLRGLKALHQWRCSALTDEGLRHLGGSTGLELFAFGDAAVTTAGLSHLAGNQGLKHLYLGNTRVDDAVVDVIKKFPALAALSLNIPVFSGARLGELSGLAGITDLGVRGEVLAARSAEILAGFPKLNLIQLVAPSDEALRQAVRLEGVSRMSVLGDGATVSGPGLAALSAMPNLAALKITGVRMTDEDAVALGALTRLRELEFENQPLRPATLAKIRQALPTCRLIYDGTALDGRNRSAAEWVLERGGKAEIRVAGGAPQAIQQVGQLPAAPFRVVSIDLTGVPDLMDADLVRLSELSRLEKLTLSKTTITDAALKHCETLWELAVLRLEATAIGDAGLESISRITSLKSLDLSRTKISDAGLAQLKTLTQLESLSLGLAKISDAGVAQFAAANKLKELWLHNTSITDAVTDTLKTFVNLEFAHLGTRGYQGARLEELATLPKLRQLHLCAYPGFIPAAHFNKLNKLPTLSILGNDGVTDEHLVELARLSQVVRMHIGYAAPTGNGLAAFEQSTSLRELTVEQIKLGQEHLEALARLKQLTHLHVANTGMDATGLALLSKALPKCAIRVTPPLPGATPTPAANESLPVALDLVLRPAQLPGVASWRVEPVVPRGSINTVDLSPDDRWIACGTEDGNVRIYSVETSELVEILPRHLNRVRGVAWSPDGNQLASCGEDGKVRLWNRASRKSLALSAGMQHVRSVAWSPDGGRLAAAGFSGKVPFWTREGADAGSLSFSGTAHVLAWSPDGRTLAVGGSQGTVWLWRDGETQPAAVAGHQVEVLSLAWSPDGTWLATGGGDGTICLWHPDGSSGPVIESEATQVYSLAWSRDGQWLASGGNRNGMRLFLWRPDGSPGPELSGHTNVILGLDWSRDGRWLVSASKDGSIRTWNEQGPLKQVVAGGGENVLRLAWHPSGERFVVGSPFNTAFVFPADGSSFSAIQRDEPRTWSVAWSPDGQRIAVGGLLGAPVRLMDANGSPIVELGKTGASAGIAFSPDGKWIAVAAGGTGRTIKLWGIDGADGPDCEGHTERATAVSWSPDSQRWVSGSMDGTVRLWDTQGKELQEIGKHDGGVLDVAWSPDGKRIASAGIDKAVRLWSTDGKAGPVLTEAAAGYTSVVWHADSQQLAAGCYDKTVRVWNTDGTPKYVLRGQPDVVSAVAWSPDGKRIVSAGGSGAVILWDAESGEPQWTGFMLESGQSVAFTPEGRMLHGDPQVLDQRLVYVVEASSGNTELLKPSAFQQRSAPKE